MSSLAVLRGVDAVTVPVPDLDQGLQFFETSWAMSWCGATMLWAKWDCACPRARQS
jgi:hypothetical protein